VYGQSKRAAERVTEGLVGPYAQLKLRVNVTKSAVAGVGAVVSGIPLLERPGKDRECRGAPKALMTMKQLFE
jgi:hypothetical protein